MRHDAGRDSGSGKHLAKCGAQFANQRLTGAGAAYQETAVAGSSLRTQSAKAFDESTDKGIHGDPAFGFELTERNVNRPLIRADGTQTIQSQIGALTDPHTGVTLQQQNVAGEIVAAQEFLLHELVLFRSQRAREGSLAARDIFAGQQVYQGGKLLGPSQVIQQTVQIDDAVEESDFGEWRNVGT
jgi:hypothetical protein